MKKVMLLLLCALTAAYGVGRMKLGESGAVRFLTQMDSLMTEGKGSEICEMFHDDLEVEVSDHTGESLRQTNGGKEEFCALTRETAAGLHVLPHTMNVNFTDVESKQGWLHPWTSEISYLENRSLSIRGTNVTLRTVSHDEITLVYTFSGVKLRKLTSEVHKAEAT